MVGGTELPERKVAVGGEDQGQQPRFQCHVAVDQADTDEDRDDRDGDGGDEFEGEGGEEGGPQGSHGPVAVLLGEVLEGLALGGGPAQSHEDGQAFGELEHVAGQPGQGRLGFPDAVFGVAADQDHKERHQRHGQHDHGGADPVGVQDAGAQQQRDGGTVHQGGQELRVVVVQGVQPPGRENGEAAIGGAG